MIVIRMELWPRGDRSRAKHLGTATIANVGGSQSVGNYRAELSTRGNNPRPWRSGSVTGFPRLRLGAWDLLFRALQAIVGDRNRCPSVAPTAPSEPDPGNGGTTPNPPADGTPPPILDE